MDLANWHMWWKHRGAAELRKLLMEHWDPIGVNGIPEAADEYDTYAGHVARMLREGASADEVAAYLARVRVESIGLGRGGPEREQDVARRINDWYEAAMRD